MNKFKVVSGIENGLFVSEKSVVIDVVNDEKWLFLKGVDDEVGLFCSFERNEYEEIEIEWIEFYVENELNMV